MVLNENAKYLRYYVNQQSKWSIKHEDLDYLSINAELKTV